MSASLDTPGPDTTGKGASSTGGLPAEQAVAAVVLFLLGLRQFLSTGMTSGYALALLLLPVWIGVLRRYRGAPLLFGTGLLALASGLVLHEFSRTDHSVSRGAGAESLALLVGVLAGVGVVLWARTVLSGMWVALFVGAGMLLSAGLFPERLGENLWKTGLAVPVAVIVLALASAPARKFAQLAVLLGLAGLSAVFDSRSYFGTFLLAALFVLWQLRRIGVSPSASWARTMAFLGVLAAGVYYLGTTLLLDGFLGQEAQLRSEAQIEASGSLLLGGRPELAASAALIQERPWGFGVGVAPNLAEINVAKAGMAALNYDPDNGYVERYMFGGRVELHSVFGDLWAQYGVAGLMLTTVVAGLVGRSVAQVVARREGGGLIVFLGLWTSWNLVFSPLYSAAPTLMLTLGLALALRPAARTSWATERSVPARPA